MGNKRGTFGASMGNDENTEIQSQSGFQRSYPHTTEETQEWEMDNITATLEACPELDPGGPANEKVLV